MRSRTRWLIAGVLLGLGCIRLAAQAVVELGVVIGAPGTNAVSVAGVGNAVNFTGVALNSGITTLVAGGSTGTSSFDFNTGFGDSLDRTIGSTAGAPNVWVDRKYDSASTGPLVLDTDRDGSFADESALTGFGMHSDAFITFDLAVIRAGADLGADTPFFLLGSAGIANTSLTPTSAAIIQDSTELAVFDWSAPTATFTDFTLTIPGSARYLTFAALSGLDGNNFFAHVGFANVQLQAIPEPSVLWLVAVGVPLVGYFARQRKRRQAKRAES